MSTGNEWTEISLDRSPTTLIVGKNGHGKSSAIEAICYALYGKPYRKINKPQLVNSITNKNCLVEVEIENNNCSYLIRRGMKPNIFEIIKDGTMIDQNSDIKDYQENLEKNILKLTYRAFSQIVVLGSAGYIPFMELDAGKRRNVIEDLLDIQIFSKMNILLKEDIVKNKQNSIDITQKISNKEYQIELFHKNQKKLKEDFNSIVEIKESQISECTDNINLVQKEIDEINKQCKKLEEETVSENALLTKKKKYLSFESDFEDTKRRLQKEIDFLNDHTTCSTCKQDIEDTFKNKTIEEKRTKIEEIKEANCKIVTELEKIDVILKEIKKINSEIITLQKQEQTKYNLIQSWNQTIISLTKEITQYKNKTSETLNDNDLIVFQDELKELNDQKVLYMEEKELLNIASLFLKDSGIKTKVIKQYIPILNQTIAKYLEEMQLFVNFELDEEFNEKIKSRHRDIFTYESFSEGEKQKISLALMLSFRDIAKQRNSASTNLLFFDEIFDGSLDSDARNELLLILDKLSHSSNIFVISHMSDDLYDKFHSIITFVKEKNFSRIAK